MLPARVESVPTGQDLEEGISNIKSPYVHSPPWLNLMCLKQNQVKKLFFFYPYDVHKTLISYYSYSMIKFIIDLGFSRC